MDQPHEKLTMTSSQLEDSGDAVLPIAGVNRWDAALLAVALTLAACLTISYMSHEDALYWSDYNYYRMMTWFLREQLAQSPLVTPVLVAYSTKLLYNFLFAVPLVPFAIAFGASRTVFVLSNVLVYLVPAAFVLGWIAKISVPSTRVGAVNLAQWSTVLLMLVTPTAWAPALRGYPDYSSAVVIWLALALYLRDSAKLSRKTIVSIGICLAVAAIVRRHFFYLAFALAASILVHQIYLSRVRKESLLAFVKGPFARWLLVGVTSAIFLGTVGFLFLTSILRTNFLSLYTSAYVPVSEGIGYFLTAFGLIAITLSLAGFLLAFKSKILDASHAVFLFSFSVLAFIVWPMFGRHVAVHYTIYAIPLVVLGNCFLFLWLMQLKGKIARGTLLTLFVVFHLANFVIGFASDSMAARLPFVTSKFGMLTVPDRRPDPIGRLFSTNFPPIVRGDYARMEALVKELELKATGRRPILVIPSNNILCIDILRNCQRRMTGSMEAESLSLYEGPCLDSRDPYPLEGILSSQLVVLPEPVQSIYKAEKAQLQFIANKAFSEDWAIASDFKKLPESFRLDGDTTISIYERCRPTSAATAIATLERMRPLISIPTAGQAPWISTDEEFVPQEQQNRDSTRVRVNKIGERTHYLLSYDVLPKKFRLSGTLVLQVSKKDPNKQLGTISGAAEFFDSAGKLLGSKEISVAGDRFNLEGETSQPAHVVLYFCDAAGIKTIKVERLSVQ